MSSSQTNQRDEAPDQLELVRAFLNTWEIPNDTRQARDLLPGLIRDRVAYHRMFGSPVPRTPDERRELVALRDDLRASLERTAPDEAAFNAWLERYPLSPRLIGDEVIYRPLKTGLAGRLLAAVTSAVAAGEWSRLKACDDCRYVYYDHTRNGSRRWCMMARGGSPTGRSCGSIAKVRSYRERQRAARP